jgi:hypothetical protein
MALDIEAIHERWRIADRSAAIEMPVDWTKLSVSVGDVPTLLAEVERLTSEQDRLGAEIHRLRQRLDEATYADDDDLWLIAADEWVRQRTELTAELDRLREELRLTQGARLLSVLFGHHEGAPRPFALQRKDRTLVALGAEFPDGAVALRLANDGGWTTKSDGGADALATSDTEILWLSDELEPLADMEQQRDAALASLAEERKQTARMRASLRQRLVALLPKIPSYCPDAQCGDSTWDHECQLGLDRPNEALADAVLNALDAGAAAPEVDDA